MPRSLPLRRASLHPVDDPNNTRGGSMKALGQGSLAQILKILLDIVYYRRWAGLVLASVIIVLIVFGGLYRLLGS